MIHLGSIGKTTIDLDLSFLILIVLFVASFYDKTMGIQYALLWAPVLFLSILLHELAHAATIALFGYGSSQVLLAGMGGLTLNARRARPWHDVIISVAGPASSFGIAWLTSRVMYNWSYASHDPMLVAFLPLLRNANILWGEFNLIPVTPLDGGHVVRNFFRMFMRDTSAFVISVWIAMIAGVAIVIWGVLRGWYFLALLIGWYVFTNFQQWQQFRKGGFPGD